MVVEPKEIDYGEVLCNLQARFSGTNTILSTIAAITQLLSQVKELKEQLTERTKERDKDRDDFLHEYCERVYGKNIRFHMAEEAVGFYGPVWTKKHLLKDKK